MKKPLISVVICTYNTKDLTLDCLTKLDESIKTLDEPVEVILVENGSDGTGKFAKNKFPYIKLLEPKTNTGFAKGNNLGINAASGSSKYFLLLNSDAFVENFTLKRAIEYMSSNKDCDVLGCKLVFENGKLQVSAGYLPTPWRIFTWAMGIDLIPGLNRILKPFHPNYQSFFSAERKVEWVTGAFLFLKREVITKTKGFDENYFMYGEEVEWFRRMKDSGFSICYTPSFKVIHLVSQSSGSTRNAFLREIEGIYYFTKKYYPRSVFWVRIFVKTGMFVRAILFSQLGNQYRAEIHKEALKIK